MTRAEETPEEREAERHIAAYFEEMRACGVSPENAQYLEALVHMAPPPRVVVLLPLDVANDDTETPREVLAPGAGLSRLSEAERATLLRLTREHYAKAAPKNMSAALEALYDKTRAKAADIADERARKGWEEVPTWSEWAAARALTADVVNFGHARVTGGWTNVLRQDAQRIAITSDRSFTIWRPEVIERVLAAYEQGRTDEADRNALARTSHRIGTHAVRSFSRSYDQRKRAALDAYRKKKLSKEERDLFIDNDATSLKGDELLVAALLLEYARQEGQLRSIPAASYRFGALTLDLSFTINGTSVEQMAHDLGAEIENDGRPEKGFRDRVSEVLESLERPRMVLVETRETPTKRADDSARKRAKVSMHAEKVSLITRTVTPDGVRGWKIHPALALGYHRGAVYLDRAAWKRGQAYIGARYLLEEMKAADVYFRMLAPAAGKEAERAGKTVTADTGAPKDLKLETLLDRFNLTVEATRGQTYISARLEKVLGFCIGTGALLGWERWEGAPKRKNAAPHLKGYRVRLPLTGPEEDEELSFFPDLDAASVTLTAGAP